MHVAWVFIGFALGILAAVPLAMRWSRRTERRVRALEQRTRVAERRGELATLTSGLAHEIKNPLSTIGLNAQLLQEDLESLRAQVEDRPDADEQLNRLRRRFDTLHREVHRLRDTLEDFLRFAGRVQLHRQPMELNALVTELADFFEPQAQAAGVKLDVQTPADPLTAAVDSSLLKQALLNLLINAVQAMQPVKQAADFSARPRRLSLQLAAYPDEPAVRLTVGDTGPGMNDATLDQLFKPYFSTKRGGTGLGLPITRRIIEEHDGTITVESTPGHGTRFIIRLPVSDESPNSGRFDARAVS